MWTLESDRRKFLDMLLGNATLTQALPVEHLPTISPKGDDLYLLWESDPRPRGVPPSVVVVADGRLRDFLAWVSTYLTSHRPFTAFFRVIEFCVLADLGVNAAPPSLNGLEQACVGTIVAEASLLSLAHGKLTTLTLPNCSGLLSYALTQALALGANLQKIEGVREEYLRARKLSDYPYIIDVATVDEIYRILFELREKGSGKSLFSPRSLSPLTDACWDISGSGKVSGGLWNQLTNGAEELRDAQDRMQGTREERVLYFQRSAVDASMGLSDSRVRNFVIGYLASLIAPGSLAHIDLVMKNVPSLPTAALWYGMCAGLHKKNDLLASYNVLGRRLLRDLLRHEPLHAPPTCDIAVAELQILQEGNGESPQFPRIASNRILVELEPFINVLLGWGKRQEGVQTGAAPSPLFTSQRESAQLLKELESHLQSALEIQRELSKRGWKGSTSEDKTASKQKGKRYKPYR